jgi:acyl carrier protein
MGNAKMNDQRLAVQERLNQVFREIFDDESIVIHDAMTAKDIYEWDSLMHITLVVGTEKEFGMELTAEEIGNLNSVGELLDIISERMTR